MTIPNIRDYAGKRVHMIGIGGSSTFFSLSTAVHAQREKPNTAISSHAVNFFICTS